MARLPLSLLLLWTACRSGSPATGTNHPPVASIDSHGDGDVERAGQAFTLTGTVSDPEDAVGTLRASWWADDQALCAAAAPDAQGGTTCTATLTAGSHDIVLEARDPAQATGTAQVNLQVEAGTGTNTAPTCRISAPADGGSSTQGDTVAFRGAAGDAESAETALGVQWSSDLDGLLDDRSPNAAGAIGFSTAALSAGAHRITLVVSDGQEDCQEGLGWTVQARVVNHAPELDSVSLAPDPPREGDTLICTPGAAHDADGDAISFHTTWTVDEVELAATDPSLDSTWWARDQEVVCVVTPDDGVDAGVAVPSNVVVVADTAPVLAEVSLGPAVVREGDTLSCTPGAVVDADGDAVSLSYAWTVDGAPIAGAAATLDSSHFAKGDAVACLVTPSDGTLSGAAVSSDPVTVSNSVAAVSDVAISPASPATSSTLSCSYAWSDADGDPDQSTLAWDINGVAAGTGPTLSGDFVVGDAVRCTVTPDDGEATATPGSASVTIGNTAPTVDSLALSPSTATTNTTLSVVVSTSDADGDSVSLSYVWRVHGTPVSTAATLSGLTAFDKGDTVQVTVTPDDGMAAGAAASTSTTVQNTAPGAPVLAIVPDPAEAGVDELLCEVVTEGADADGDALSYALSWQADGLSYPAGLPGAAGPTTTTWPDDTVPAADTALASAWTCTATPDDGETTGASATASRTVLETYDLGNDTALDLTSTSAADTLLGTWLTVPAATTLYRVGVIMAAGGPQVRLALYTDSGGAPGSRVAVTGTTTTVSGANELELATPVALAAGTYWLMAVYDTDASPYSTETTTQTVYSQSLPFSTVPPATLAAPSSYCCQDFSYYLVVAD